MKINLPMKQKGIALIVVLWMMAIMTLIALVFSQGVRTDVLLSGHFTNQVKATSLAEEGIWRAVMMLLDKAPVNTLQEKLRLDGSPYELSVEQGQLRVSLQSESALIDLNRATDELLLNLLETTMGDIDQASAIVAAILDWRDADSLTRLSGAEDNEYAIMGVEYGARDGMINSVDELRRIRGVSQELFEKLLPMVTIFSGQTRIAVQVAPREVLLSLPDMTPGLVDNILAERASDPNYAIMPMLPARARKYAGAVQSKYIRISSRAEVNGTAAGITAVILLKPGVRQPVTVISWRDGYK